MPKKKTLAEVKSAFYEVWGDRFVYDHITEDNYVNMSKKVPVECRKHGVFFIEPSRHISGTGCKRCGEKRWGRILGGVAINGYDDYVKKDRVYSVWTDIIRRCYDKRKQGKHKSYKLCSVCEEWLDFRNFKKWYDENYVEGYAVDKDILIIGNKVYSPDTCCFVPKEINSMFRTSKKRDLPIGVKKACNRYCAIQTCGDARKYIGSFETVEEARDTVNKVRKEHFYKIAKIYKDNGGISQKVYDAIIKRIESF